MINGFIFKGCYIFCMDGKIVAATFASLAVVFTGMSGGSINADVDEVLPSEDSPVNDLTSSFSLLDSLMENPETEHPVTMEITLAGETQVNIKAETITVEGLKNIESTLSADSEQDLTLRNFNGNIAMTGNNTEIVGSAKGFSNSEINVSSEFGIDREIDTEKIDVKGLERNAFTLNAEEFSLESNETGSSISKSNTEVEITSFTGDIVFRPSDRMSFEGEVAEVNAGTTSFGD